MDMQMNSAAQTMKKKEYTPPEMEAFVVKIHPIAHSDDWAGAKQRPVMIDEEDDYGEYGSGSDGNAAPQSDDYWE